MKGQPPYTFMPLSSNLYFLFADPCTRLDIRTFESDLCRERGVKDKFPVCFNFWIGLLMRTNTNPFKDSIKMV